MQKVHRWLAVVGMCAIFICTRTVAQDAQPESATGASAVVVVEQLLVGLVEAARIPDVNARVEFLRDIVLTSHDLDYIGQLTVRRRWREWTEAQRSSFLAAFTALSVMSYAARFANVNEESFAIVGPESAGSSRIQVRTTVARADGTHVPLDFVLQTAKDDGWRIANVIADGVSDLALRRAEYTTTLNESGFDGLVADLEAQTRDLAQAADND
jgi:phospholipid transport system substrate-binding protein